MTKVAPGVKPLYGKGPARVVIAGSVVMLTVQVFDIVMYKKRGKLDFVKILSRPLLHSGSCAAYVYGGPDRGPAKTSAVSQPAAAPPRPEKAGVRSSGLVE